MTRLECVSSVSSLSGPPWARAMSLSISSDYFCSSYSACMCSSSLYRIADSFSGSPRTGMLQSSLVLFCSVLKILKEPWRHCDYYQLGAQRQREIQKSEDTS